jgi:DNA polymerase-3 subunit epsilon
MNFVAIDFETATSQRDSPCEIGLTLVKDSSIVSTKSWLIKPRQYPDFNPFNVRIHGIRPQDVENQPELDKLWPEIEPLLSNSLVIAHNARFDIAVLRKTLDYYSIAYPNIDFACSYILSRGYWKGLPSYNLESLCKEHNIKLEHHRAGEDSRACAELTLKIFSEAGVKSVEDMTQKLKLFVGRLNLNSISPAEKDRLDSLVQLSNSNDSLESNKQSSIFYGKTVVFTGTLTSMMRDDAKNVLTMVGGINQNSINKSTNYLVVGQQDYRVVGEDGMSSKQEKAIKYIEQGYGIEIISEDDFLRNI